MAFFQSVNGANQYTAVTDRDSSCAFGYNPRSEVTAASIATNMYSYSYDSIGNSLHSARNAATNRYTANALNQCTEVTGAGAAQSFIYDADGNLTAWNGRDFGWNSENRLCEAVTAGSDCGFMRDGSGRCFTDWDYAEDTYTDRVFDGWNPVFERTFDGLTETPVCDTVYVWGTDLSGSMQGAGGVGGLLAVRLNGTWHVPLYDANGNVTAYVSETGAVVAEYEYDAFGNTISQSGSLPDTFRHRFSTKPWIPALGAYDYGERMYSPELRRWMSRDPIEENGGLNLYAICGNDAVNGVDPQGMFTVRAVSQSPRYSAKSDFWFSIAFDFSENDHQAGAVWVTKSRKVDLYECGSNKKYKGLSDLSQITSVLVEGRIPRRRSREELVAFLFTDGKERGYVEVFSENKLKNVCGKIEYDIVVEYKKASPFVNGKSIQDKHRLKWYNFTPVSQGGNGDLRASYHVLLSYSCNRMDGPEADSESEKFLGVWGKRFPGMIDRVDDSRNTRAGTGSFPYFDSTD
ncbi:MAG: RHS repeat-associated core domain-containing protein [Kiritimatiellae bacterium]|nr:RHS repeat-associated core domain-containing protein [Kiritimatiellia bacterium]